MCQQNAYYEKKMLYEDPNLINLQDMPELLTALR